jgi:hypothetical protein
VVIEQGLQLLQLPWQPAEPEGTGVVADQVNRRRGRFQGCAHATHGATFRSMLFKSSPLRCSGCFRGPQ